MKFKVSFFRISSEFTFSLFSLFGYFELNSYKRGCLFWHRTPFLWPKGRPRRISFMDVPLAMERESYAKTSSPFYSYLAQSSQKEKKGKKWILMKYGKRTPWISCMYFLTLSIKCQNKKIWKKMRCRCTFWPGRQIGRNGCRPWKCAKFEIFFSSKSWPLCS